MTATTWCASSSREKYCAAARRPKIHIATEAGTPLCGTSSLWKGNVWVPHPEPARELECRMCRRKAAEA